MKLQVNHLARLGAGQRLHWPCCRFQASTNLQNWNDLGGSVAGSDGIVRFTDTNAPAYPYRFYRFVAP